VFFFLPKSHETIPFRCHSKNYKRSVKNRVGEGAAGAALVFIKALIHMLAAGAGEV
jgi:ectoine hydroxylase-related dioxygenase (phytanoyl-CoA dioxygenase family)